MKFIVAASAALFGATSAFAADLPAPIYTKAPIVVDPGYNWTGFYLGANVGYSWGRSSGTSALTNGAGTTLFTSSGGSNLDGIVGGGQAGYNWQMQNWVWGLEADIQGTGERGSRDFTCPTGICTPGTLPAGFLALVFVIPGAAVPVSLEQKIDWFGTVRGRVGILATPRVLFYATGGLAYGDVSTNETIGASSFSASDLRVGYTVGGGIEGALGGNWSAKLEYLYVDLGRTSGSFTTAIPAFGSGTVASGTLASSYSSRVTDNVLRVGLNYKFSGGPVVAKY
ncbi:outer membrane protein [Bradyrhizobium canariense]|uniref:Outer membrane immunogenic protein n=1 Tax=Bradyrhizobium canariense TaxID=255045 RepID=A0A1H1RJG5_9BRAD|nr:outer membrane beta-barrel protein [Bradyrhizobium canariense]SDS35793.1 outer membrane immunogenic protein [Bradyrhizobium canariense]